MNLGTWINELASVIWNAFLKNKSLQFYVILLSMYVSQTIAFVYILPISSSLSLSDVLLMACSDGMLILLPYIVLPRKFRWTFGVGIAIYTFWLLSNLWYSRTYFELMPLRSYFLFDNVSGVLIDSAIGSLQWVDWMIVLPIIIVVIVYYKYYKRFILQNNKSLAMVIMTMTIVVCLWYNIRRTYCDYNNRNPEGTYVENFYELTHDRWLWQKTCYPPFSEYYYRNGWIAYMWYNISHWSPEVKLTAEQETVINNFLKNSPAYSDNQFADGNIGKNLIFIVVESLSSWVIDYSIDGHEVTPTLNSFFNDSSSIAIRNAYAQVLSGRSSDGHFVYNTGILPCQTTQTAMKFGEVPYPSLAKALKQNGYKAYNVLSDDIAFWNQGTTSHSYGFDKTYQQSDYDPGENTERINLDKLILSSSVDIMANDFEQPFYAMVVTISMHFPWTEVVDGTPEWLKSANLHDKTKSYLSITHQFDARLNLFLQKLKEKGLYENSVIVVAGDHEGLCLETSEMNKMVPIVILNSGHNVKNEEVVGMVDLYPTLLDVMGANQYPWKGVGHSLLRNDVISTVTPKYEILGDNKSPLAERQKRSWFVSHYIIASRYFEKHQVGQ